MDFLKPFVYQNRGLFMVILPEKGMVINPVISSHINIYIYTYITIYTYHIHTHSKDSQCGMDDIPHILFI